MTDVALCRPGRPWATKRARYSGIVLHVRDTTGVVDRVIGFAGLLNCKGAQKGAGHSEDAA